jgi:hypothetical protein
MKKSISVNKKPIGRPKKKGGVYPVSAVRLPPEISAGVDAWASNQSDKPARSEAIRRLVELGLAAGTKSLPRQRRQATSGGRAKELASKAIDKLSDSLATTVDQASRKRQLLKGPKEFRGARVDLPKAKK